MRTFWNNGRINLMKIIERLPEGPQPQPQTSLLTPRVLGFMFVGLIVGLAVIGLLLPMPLKVYFLVTAGALTPWFLIICFYFARDHYRRRRYLTGR